MGHSGSKQASSAMAHWGHSRASKHGTLGSRRKRASNTCVHGALGLLMKRASKESKMEARRHAHNIGSESSMCHSMDVSQSSTGSRPCRRPVQHACVLCTRNFMPLCISTFVNKQFAQPSRSGRAQQGGSMRVCHEGEYSCLCTSTLEQRCVSYTTPHVPYHARLCGRGCP